MLILSFLLSIFNQEALLSSFVYAGNHALAIPLRCNHLFLRHNLQLFLYLLCHLILYGFFVPLRIPKGCIRFSHCWCLIVCNSLSRSLQRYMCREVTSIGAFQERCKCTVMKASTRRCSLYSTLCTAGCVTTNPTLTETIADGITKKS